MQNQRKSQPSTIALTFQRLFMKSHIFFYRKTEGKLGGNLLGRPMLLLTTIGRKTRKERTTPILYVPDGERVILIASNGGAVNNPQWWGNLQKTPQAMIQIGAERRFVTADEAIGEERERLWSMITSRYSNFADYQKRTSRQIPIVILTPRVDENK